MYNFVDVLKLEEKDIGRKVSFKFLNVLKEGIIMFWRINGVVNVVFGNETIPIKQNFLRFVNDRTKNIQTRSFFKDKRRRVYRTITNNFKSIRNSKSK